MEKKGVLSTLRFIFFTILALVLIFSAVLVTVLNTYKPAVKTYLGGNFLGYFSSEQQFDEVYNDLVAEKQNIDPNVKVYLESEPLFETSYIRDSLLSEQNIYDNLRAVIKTEFTVYNVAVNGETKMTFLTEDEANKYTENLSKQVSKLKTEIKIEKVEDVNNKLTSIERAESILKDIVDRNKPIVRKVTTNNYSASTSNTSVSSSVANSALAQGGIWPTNSRLISSSYGWRWGDFHSGVDIAGRYGDAILAYKDGVVRFSGWNASGYGYLVKIDHGNGFSTWYAHCSKLLVSAGQEVKQGQKIAAMGSTGFSTGNHLHFEVRLNNVHSNSYPYISAYK